MPAAFVGCLLLTGCGGGDDPAGADSPGIGPSAALTSPLPTPTVAMPTVTPRIRVVAGLPAGFPTTIPLYDAAVIAGSRGEPGARFGWTVVMQPPGNVKRIADRAADLLDDAGFHRGVGTDLPTLQVRQYDNDQYVVGLTVVHNSDGNTMTYTVSEK